MPIQDTRFGLVFELLWYRLPATFSRIHRFAAHKRKKRRTAREDIRLSATIVGKKGQSREMVQYGFYTNSNRVYPGCKVAEIEREPVLVELIDLLIKHGVIKDTERPDQCTVNVYSPGMWLPPHVDNCKFISPLITVSLVSEQSVVFGKDIKGKMGLGKASSNYRCRLDQR